MVRVSSSPFQHNRGNYSEQNQQSSMQSEWESLFPIGGTTNSVDSPFLGVSAPSDGAFRRVTDRALENIVDLFYSNGKLNELFSRLNDRDMVIRVAGRVIELVFSEGSRIDHSLSRGVAAIYLVNDVAGTITNPRERLANLKSQRCILLQKSGDFPGEDLELASIFSPNIDRPGFHTYSEINPLFLTSKEEAAKVFKFKNADIDLLKDNEFVIIPLTTRAFSDIQIGTIVAVRPKVFAEHRESDYSFMDSLEQLSNNIAKSLIRSAKREALIASRRVG